MGFIFWIYQFLSPLFLQGCKLAFLVNCTCKMRQIFAYFSNFNVIVNTFVEILNLKYSKLNVILIRVCILFMTCYQQLFFQGCNLAFFCKMNNYFLPQKGAKFYRAAIWLFFTSVEYCLVVNRDYNQIFYDLNTSKDWNLRATWKPMGTVMTQIHSLLHSIYIRTVVSLLSQLRLKCALWFQLWM